MLAPPRRQSLIPPLDHANSPAQIPPAGRPCWRPAAGKASSHRRATPTVRPKSRLPAVHVGASPPAKAYPTAGQRQQSGPNPACRLSMLALPRWQNLTPPLDHANRPARIPPGSRPCWRLSTGNALCHRWVTPTGRLKSRPAAVHVGAPSAGKTLSHRRTTLTGRPESRLPGAHVGALRRQNLIPPPGHANSPAQIPLAGRPCWRPSAVKTLCHRRATPTVRSKSRLPAAHVGASPLAKPYATVGPRQQAGSNPACRPPMLAWSGSAATPFYTEIYKPTIFCLHLDRYGLKNSLPIKTVLKGNFFYEIIVLSMESCNI